MVPFWEAAGGGGGERTGLADKSVPSPFEKRPIFDNKNISNFSALFPSPPIPSFVSGLIFLPWHFLC